MDWNFPTAAQAGETAAGGIPTLPMNFAMPDWGVQFLIAFAVCGALYWLVKPVLEDLGTTFREKIFSNWRLGLLALTGLVLSLASGWTTWDGMKNFTNEPLLSLMITFGIQGVMLIIAWLIGESFATGMNQQAMRSGGFSRRISMFFGPIIGICLFVALAAWLIPWQPSDQSSLATGSNQPSSITAFGDQLIVLVIGLLAIALVFVYAASDIVKPYIQSTRVVAKNAVLWVMFLSCMATSVFFSFDSLFANIFPQSERVRAAELRAQNQVAGIVADIDQTITKRRLSAVDDLFVSEGWQAYDEQLARLAKVAKESEGDVEKFFHEQAEARNRAIKEQQERIVSAQSGQAGLSEKKISLSNELARLKTERPTLAAEYAEKKNDLDQRAKEIDSKRVEAMAEERGVEGTGKVGRGPEYRARKAELNKLNDYYKIGEERVKDAKKRYDAAQDRIAQIERELAQVDGELATLKGEATTAAQRIEMSQSVSETSDGDMIDPSRMLPAFENARVAFRQGPNSERLSDVQKVCSQVLGAMLTATPTTKEKVKGITCDPKRASEAAALVFALNVGARTFASNCVGGTKLAANSGTDALFSFAKSCLADSGLPSEETDSLRKKINFIELNRDDKAHRFVVTWNAFNDGNRLAYLALGIAIAIDMLVFMSGLFGANAVRSPLSDVPTMKARSAQQLEAIIENALLPDTFENARLTLSAMRPITNIAGYMAEVRTDLLDPHTRARVHTVLNAGATIHAVAYDEEFDRYLIRSELFEFLSVVSKKAFEGSDVHVNQAELEKIVSVALLPEIGSNVDTVLRYLHPLSNQKDYTAEINLLEVEDDLDKRVVRNVLNAGATLSTVHRPGVDPNHYHIHKDLYQTLARIRARALYDGNSAHLRLPPKSKPEAEHRGALKAAAEPKIAPPPASDTKMLTTSALEPLSKNEIEKHKKDYRRQFLLELNIHDEAICQAISQSDIIQAAHDAWSDLERYCKIHYEREKLLAGFLKQHQDSVKETAQALEEQASRKDVRLVPIVRDVASEIRDAESLLLFSPEISLLNYFKDGLEGAISNDPIIEQGEEELLNRLRMIEEVLKNSGVENAESWQRISDELNRADDDLALPEGILPFRQK